MVQNPWFVFPQFCTFLKNCCVQLAHTFKVACLTDRTTLCQELMMHHASAITENSEQNRTCCAFLGFGSCGRFHCNYFACNGDNVRAIAMSMWRCVCSKFRNFGAIFAAACFMPKTSVIIAWHEPNDMPISSATSFIMIRRLCKIIIFTASIFSSVVDVPGRANNEQLAIHIDPNRTKSQRFLQCCIIIIKFLVWCTSLRSITAMLHNAGRFDYLNR